MSGIRLSIWLMLNFFLSSVAGCPDGCTCTAYGVTCSGVTSLPKDSFTEDDITRIKIENSFISEIRPNAFSNVSISYLTFENVSISTIHTNAFQNVSVSHFKLGRFSLDTLMTGAFTDVDMSNTNIDHGVIGTIESNAFRNATFLNFVMYANNISIIETDAFNNISVVNCKMYDLNITSLRTRSFSSNFSSTNFNFYNAYISHMEDYAINFDDDHVLLSKVYNIVVVKMGCHAFDGVFKKENITTPERCGSQEGKDKTRCSPGCWCGQSYIVCGGLTEFPDLRAPLVKTLSINNSTFTVPNNATDNLPDLHTVTMSHVTILNTEHCAFRNLQANGIISLQRVTIRDTMEGVFCNLNGTDFDLFGVSIGAMKERTFHNVTTTFFKIANTVIKSIEQRAFDNVNFHLINIFNVNISTINANAFENLEGPNFRVYNSSLGTLKSRSFDNMDVNHLNLFNLTVSTIESGAFTDNLKAENFKVYKSNITNLEDYAFNISQVQYSAMYSSFVVNSGCHAFDGLNSTSKLVLLNPCKDVNSAEVKYISMELLIASVSAVLFRLL